MRGDVDELRRPDDVTVCVVCSMSGSGREDGGAFDCSWDIVVFGIVVLVAVGPCRKMRSFTNARGMGSCFG